MLIIYFTENNILQLLLKRPKTMNILCCMYFLTATSRNVSFVCDLTKILDTLSWFSECLCVTTR